MSIGLMRKLIAGDNCRKTRLHDERGNFVDWQEWVYLPLVLHRFIARYIFGRRFVEPWWTFRIKARVGAILTPEMSVIEFGAGQSTFWFAGRVGQLLSIEDDPEWFAVVRDGLRRLRLSNVDLQLRTPEVYSDLSGVPDRSVDFCSIDGIDRALCAAAVLPKMKPGGLIYLDNTDKAVPDDGRNVHSADLFLQKHAHRIETFTGFTIGSANTHQGRLFHLP